MHQMHENHADIPRHQAERTLSTEVEGVNVTGTFDLYYEDGVLTDYKFVSVWTTMNGVKEEWQQQLRGGCKIKGTQARESIRWRLDSYKGALYVRAATI
jgi:hypothetical protein